MLKIENAIAGYNGVPVLHGVSIQVAKGEAVAVVGANGAGKSTLVRVISGLTPTMSGQVQFNAVNISQVPASRRLAHGIAIVPEGRNLFTELTVAENLALAEAGGRKYRAAQSRFTLEEIYRLFPVLAERKDSMVSLLSGGQQQMLAIARALLLQPELLVMDELTTGLAPKVVKEILVVLNTLRQRGMSILLVEQSVSVAADMTDRTYVMSVGRVVQEIQKEMWPELLKNEALVKAYLHG